METSGVDMSTEKFSPMLTVKDVKNRLGMSISFVYQELRSGKLEHYQLGKAYGAIRISEEQFSSYLENFVKGKKKTQRKSLVTDLPLPVNKMSAELNNLFKKEAAA